MAGTPGRTDQDGDWWRRRSSDRPAAAALYHREWLVRLGGFDESFFCYFEDVDLNLRLQVAGGRCLYVPSAHVRHVGGASTGGLSAFTIYHSQRNLVWTFVKSTPPHLFWRYLPMHVLLNVGSIVSYGIRGHTKTAVAGEAGRSARASGDGARAPVGDGIARVRSRRISTPLMRRGTRTLLSETRS